MDLTRNWTFVFSFHSNEWPPAQGRHKESLKMAAWVVLLCLQEKKRTSPYFTFTDIRCHCNTSSIAACQQVETLLISTDILLCVSRLREPSIIFPHWTLFKSITWLLTALHLPAMQKLTGFPGVMRYHRYYTLPGSEVVLQKHKLPPQDFRHRAEVPVQLEKRALRRSIKAQTNRVSLHHKNN